MKSMALSLTDSQRSNIANIDSIVQSLDARDPYTADHSYRVALFLLHLYVLAGGNPASSYDMFLGGLLHDIGKIGIPDAILHKEGKLSQAEYEIVKNHTTIGHGIVQNMRLGIHFESIVRSHHERVDGNGYPDGIPSLSLGLAVRATAIADSFDAMTSTRSYRSAFSVQEAVTELRRCAGLQFDGDLVELWCNDVANTWSVEQLVYSLENRYRGLGLEFMRPGRHSDDLPSSRNNFINSITMQRHGISSAVNGMFEFSPVPGIIIDENYNVIRANAAFHDIFGWNETAVTTTMLPHVPRDEIQSLMDHLSVVWSAGKKVMYMSHRIAKNGELLDCETYAFPVKTLNNKVQYVGATYHILLPVSASDSQT